MTFILAIIAFCSCMWLGPWGGITVTILTFLLMAALNE